MTNERAEQAANIVLAAAALGVAVVVVRTPGAPARGVALAVTALTGTLPVWVAQRGASRLERERQPQHMIGP